MADSPACEVGTTLTAFKPKNVDVVITVQNVHIFYVMTL
jgi:hypothetical protein